MVCNKVSTAPQDLLHLAWLKEYMRTEHLWWQDISTQYIDIYVIGYNWIQYTNGHGYMWTVPVFNLANYGIY